MAIEAGPLDPFNHSFSIIIECDDQAEIDRLWDALKAGGSEERCGWLRGPCWQMTLKRLGALMRDSEPDKARRVAAAMLKMAKFHIAGWKPPRGVKPSVRGVDGVQSPAPLVAPAARRVPLGSSVLVDVG